MITNHDKDYQKQMTSQVTVEAADDTAGYVDIVVTDTPAAYSDFLITGLFIVDSSNIEKTSGFDVSYSTSTGAVRIADAGASLVTTGDVIALSGHLVY